VRVRGGNRINDGQGRVENLNGLNERCKVTVLRLVGCQLGRTGAISLAEAIASFLSTSLVELDLRGNDIEEGGGRALAETLRLNTTLTSLNLGYNRLGEGGGRALAETVRLNTTLTSLSMGVNGLGEGGGRALAETLRLNATLKSMHLCWNRLAVEQESALREALRAKRVIRAWRSYQYFQIAHVDIYVANVSASCCRSS